MGVVLLGSCTSTSDRGVVTGGIQACTAIPGPDTRSYAAGTVSVFVDHSKVPDPFSEPYSRAASAPPVARADVAVNQTYRFSLPPGRYLLFGDYPPNSVHPSIKVTVSSDTTAHADIPDPCI